MKFTTYGGHAIEFIMKFTAKRYERKKIIVVVRHIDAVFWSYADGKLSEKAGNKRSFKKKPK
jgi:hypothetical protein